MPTVYPPQTPNPYYRQLEPARPRMGGAIPIPPAQRPRQPMQFTGQQGPVMAPLPFGESQRPPSEAIKLKLEAERTKAIAARNNQMQQLEQQYRNNPDLVRMFNIGGGDPEERRMYEEVQKWRKMQPPLAAGPNSASVGNDSNSAFGPPLFESDAYAPMLAAASDRGSMHPNSQPNIPTYSGMKRG